MFLLVTCQNCTVLIVVCPLLLLKELDLSTNELSDAPDYSSLLSLERLDLANNKIASLKGFKCSVNLTDLDLSMNQIASLEGFPDLPNLHDLSLANNQLTSLQGIGALSKLMMLRLQNNRLESIDELSELPNLAGLNLKSNKIMTLPKFQKKIARLEVDTNLMPKIAPKAVTKPKLVLPNDAKRVSSLPVTNGKFSGGGVLHSKTVMNSGVSITTPKSFYFAQEGKSLTGTAGINVHLQRRRITDVQLTLTEARVTISVTSGRVRIYLKHPGDHQFFKNSRGNDDFKTVPNKDFIYADATPEQPCTLQGQILSPKHGNHDIILEALDGSASGVSYVITDS